MGRGSGGSLLLLLPPVHGGVTILTKPQPAILSSGAPEASDGQGLVISQVIWIEASRTKDPLSPSSEPVRNMLFFVSCFPSYTRFWGKEENSLPGLVVPSQDPALSPAFYALPDFWSVCCRATAV